MKSDQLSFRPGFRLSVGNARSQAAVMVLPAGGKEGGPDNNHRGADQWLFVVEGTGAAIIQRPQDDPQTREDLAHRSGRPQ